MAKHNAPRRGSLAFWPRKRAKSQLPRVLAWASSPTPCILGFAGYKAGQTSVVIVDDTMRPTKGQEIVLNCTIVEAPPIVIYGIRAYRDGMVVCDEFTPDEKVILKLRQKLTSAKKIDENSADEIFVLAFVEPAKTGIGKKHIERLQIAVGGNTAKAKLDYARTLLGKELSASEVFKPGEYCDAVAITRGKGWQGSVKRFGIAKQRRKATGRVRHLGNLGPWHPGYVTYTIPQAGQMGYHKRTDYNKRLLKIGKPDDVNKKSGFKNYGVLKNDYVLFEGTLPGPVKRLVRFRKAIRKGEQKPKPPNVVQIVK
ncbi:50S ribosomal protein L3 [Candidatus Micrarchaeota archaeon CG08_land_8_20_14_0_20_49_17]|nr:MAG: 50S ribosomal protein L3 [Candidatus Micrarchaeota archaeon CG08_land_8_20_14_0_20_49_17]PIU82482.1 MAG: 50S ribosomal protein L3 [Candidatus Micrarchaeota archaeon CG06_land_8_20_14_3_00_50_6]PIZ92704.1 MAG: 50S ribosomal protein L3 [Candidatus Micrarchaeota archaeon CG_4_10_14_0_2_um_filter_49_7]